MKQDNNFPYNPCPEGGDWCMRHLLLRVSPVSDAFLEVEVKPREESCYYFLFFFFSGKGDLLTRKSSREGLLLVVRGGLILLVESFRFYDVKGPCMRKRNSGQKYFGLVVILDRNIQRERDTRKYKSRRNYYLIWCKAFSKLVRTALSNDNVHCQMSFRVKKKL